MDNRSIIKQCFSFPLTLGMQKTGLPLILTSGKLKNLCFVIDTGSTHNILFNFVYKHFRDEFKLLTGTQSLTGIEGHSKETPTIEATFNFEGRDYTSTFSVLEANEAIKRIQNETGVQIHGVLGVQFLIKTKWIIDFNKLEINT